MRRVCWVWFMDVLDEYLVWDEKGFMDVLEGYLVWDCVRYLWMYWGNIW